MLGLLVNSDGQAGAQDGVVKYWDLRHFVGSTQAVAVALCESDEAPENAKQVPVSCLCLTGTFRCLPQYLS